MWAAEAGRLAEGRVVRDVLRDPEAHWRHETA